MLNIKRFFKPELYFAFLLVASVSKAEAQNTCNKHLVMDYFATNEADYYEYNVRSNATGSAVNGTTYQDGPSGVFGEILGGQRDLNYTFTRVNMGSSFGSGNSISFSNETFSITTGPNVIPSKITLTYDGMDNSSSIDASYGLGGIDLTKYLSVTTTLTFLESIDAGRSFSITYRVFSSSNEYSDAVYQVVGPSTKINSSTLIHVPVSSFQKAVLATSAADLTSINAIQIILQTDQPALDYTFFGGMYFYCGGNAPLPVTFGYFKGQSINGNNQLNWQTYNENDNKGFEVQRKGKDDKFVTIGFVDAKSNNSQSGVEQRYTFIDQSPFTGTTYYRLKQIDANGMTDYSKTISVSNEGQKGMSFQIFPNPLTGGKANILLAGNKGRVSLSLIDMSGNIVRKWEKGNYTQLDMSNLNRGVYILKANDESGAQTAIQRITVQ